MRVFDFTLLSGYEFSGVDVAQGFRARLFAKNNVNAKFIFTELPTIRDMELYGSQKIKRGQIMSAHLFMTGRLDMSLSVKKEALLIRYVERRWKYVVYERTYYFSERKFSEFITFNRS